MTVRRWLSQSAISLRAGLIVALVVLVFWQVGLFNQIRLQLTNIYYVSRPTTDHIVIIAADDASLQQYGRALSEWPRTRYADLVTILDAAGARVAVFDILFAETTEQDTALIASIQQARNSDNRLRVVMPVVGVQQTPNTAYDRVDAFLLPTQSMAEQVDYLGVTNVIPDADGVVRWQLMQMQSPTDNHWGLSLAAYLAWQRIPSVAADQLVRFDGQTLTLPSGRDLRLGDTNRLMFDYFDTPGNAFPVYSLQDVLAGRVDPTAFEDKVVFIGLMNSTGQTDEHRVPIGIGGVSMAGVEIHAQTLESLIQNRLPVPQSSPSQAAMIILLALGASLIYGWLPPRWYLFSLFLSVIVSVTLVVIVSALFFSSQLIVVNLFDALLAVVLPAPTVLAQNFLLETRLRRRTELLLASMVNATQQNLGLEDTLTAIATDFQMMLRCKTVNIWLYDDSEGRALTLGYPSNQPDAKPNRDLQGVTALHVQDHRLIVPLVWRGQGLGVLEADGVQGSIRPIQRLIDRFVWQSTAVLSNVHLYTESQQLNALKTRMIRMASHDLKNPLGVITGYLELLSVGSGDLPDATRGRFLMQMNRAANEMLAIVNDILNLERIRRGDQHFERFNLNNKMHELALYFEGKAEQQQMTFRTEFAADPLIIEGDEDQLHHALSNLIDNAIKYTPQGGIITVRLAQNDGHAHIEVQDTGYGIPSASVPKLFQEFYRVRTKNTEHIEGTGLGLSLVKAVITSHRGRVWVNSEEDKGSTFFVELPLATGTGELG